jgi:hypothetical protein
MKRFLISTALLALLLGTSMAHKEVVDEAATPATIAEDAAVITETPINPDYIEFPTIAKEEEYTGEKDFAYCKYSIIHEYVL